MRSQQHRWAVLFVCAVLLASCGGTAGLPSSSSQGTAASTAGQSGERPTDRPRRAEQPTAASEAGRYTEEPTVLPGRTEEPANSQPQASAAAETADQPSGTEPAAGGPTQPHPEVPRNLEPELAPEVPPDEPLPPRRDRPATEQPYDSTYFRNYGVNPFVDTREDSLSTFGMDVDTASYGIMRRFIADGYLPNPDSVRVEEYLNAFDYDYPRPDDGASFAIYSETAPSLFGGAGYEILQVGIRARDIVSEERKPTALTFVIDVSGSMARENRLETVKQALGLLVEQLRPDDSIAVVAYDDRAWVALDATAGSRQNEILNAIDQLQPGGSTNVEAGLDLGFDLAEEAFVQGSNQVLLLSDGVANAGEVDPERLVAKYDRSTGRGIKLSTIGVGMGNYNDVILEQLADRGNGAYHYVDTLDEARRVFVEQLEGTLQLVARDAKIQVEFNPDVVQRYRLVGYENRDVRDEQFRDDGVDAGEIGAGHSVTALYEIRRFEDATGDLATVRIRYHRPDNTAVIEEQAVARADAAHHAFDDATARFRMAVSVAQYAELLRHERLARGSALEDLLDTASLAARELHDDGGGQEFVDLLYRAAAIAGHE